MLPTETERGFSQNTNERVNPKQQKLRAPTLNMGTERSIRKLKAAENMAWFYIKKLDEAITVEDLATYTTDIRVTGVKKCEQL